MNRVIALALVLALLANSGIASADVANEEGYYASMLAVSRSPHLSNEKKITALEEQYAFSVAPLASRLELLSDAELLVAFNAANMLAVYTIFFNEDNNHYYVKSMSRFYAEMRDRGADTSGVAANMIDAYVAARDFSSAQKLIAAEARNLAGLPVVERAQSFDPNKPAAFYPVGDHRVSLRNFDLHSGKVIVIVSGCHFADDAIADINASPILASAFARAKTIWILPADRNFEIAEISKWSRSHPSASMAIAYKHAPWKGVDFSRMPNFYFYNDGELIATHAGWKKDSVSDEILLALRNMGLLSGAASP